MNLAHLFPDWRYRALILTLTKRRVASRYRGTILGVAWSLLLPLLMVTVFTLVFNHFLHVRWPSTAIAESASAESLHAALNIYLGLLVFNYAAETLGSAPYLVLEHPHYVKKILFPLPILAYVHAASTLLPLFGGTLVAALLALWDPAAHPARLILLTLYWLPLPLWALTLYWLIGSIGVYLRDIAHLIPPLSTALMFLSPVFYTATTLSEPWHTLIYLNPLTPAIESARALLFPSTLSTAALIPLPDPSPTLISLTAATLFCYLARRLFVKLQSGFADVL
ncbi:ABC transporter permease [Hydrogenophilus thiooxidans]|uniref:ABC transporter permease n=1 Tax=Hydrogenophilus thiooxidans TaxID=2820326 RepID=UPI001C248ED4|nr:ABC transporter permease [Hydrogenophilus thiooxidans]